MEQNHTPASSPEATPVSAPTAPTVAAAPSVDTAAAQVQYVTLGSALMLCVFTCVITLMIAMYGPAIAEKYELKLPGVGRLTGSKIVFLDFEKVVGQGIKQAVENGGSVQDVQKDAEQFQARISSAIKGYTDQGYSVVNAKALIESSKHDDITEDVIAKVLGRQQP